MTADVKKFVNQISDLFDIDLSIYDDEFFTYALGKRVTITHMKNIAGYLDLIKKDHDEIIRFKESLYITYSKFFRETLSYAVLEQNVLPVLLTNKPNSELRIWSAGCAKGQEAYSVAILLSELAEAMQTSIHFRILATDVSEDMITSAKNGTFCKSDVEEVKTKYLSKYFNMKEDVYQIHPALKNKIEFVTYDLLDTLTAYPPESIFGDFDLVLCCNVLIYYRFEQKKFILNKLIHSISKNGYFVTGHSEQTFVKQMSILSPIHTTTTVFKK